jgi:hypothetical protein
MGKMQKIKFLTSLVLVMVIVVGCGGSQGSGLLSSSGRSSEVLVVCSEKQWKGELGDSLQAILMQSAMILPQYEPIFLLSHVSPQRFRDAYQKQRNIIMLSIDTSLEKGKISVMHNTWATSQIVIHIAANSTQGLIDVISARQNEMINRLMACEMKRFFKVQKSHQDFRLSREIEKKYKIAMVTPDGFIFAVKNKNFCWLRRDTKDWIQSIMIYVQDYVSTEQFSEKHIVHLRDSLTKQYVFGAADSSYVITHKKYLPPFSEPSSAFDEHYAIRTVGLWETENDYQSGPFVNYTFLDEKTNRIITFDAFLYAPSEKKRDLLRQLEAVLLNATVKNEDEGEK